LVSYFKYTQRLAQYCLEVEKHFDMPLLFIRGYFYYENNDKKTRLEEGK